MVELRSSIEKKHRMCRFLLNCNEFKSKPTGIGVVNKGLYLALSNNNIECCNLDTSRIIPFDFLRERIINSSKFPIMMAHRILWNQFVVPKLMKDLNCDYFLSSTIEAPLLVNVRSLVFAHDLIPLRFPSSFIKKIFYKTYIPLVLKQSIHILSNSYSTRHELIKTYSIEPSKISVIKLGYDRSSVYPLSLKRENFFLILGRHDHHKNILNILKAISLLKCKDYQFIFAGPFHKILTPKLKRACSRLGISDRCDWIEWVDNVKKLSLLNRCKALLIPSLWEGFGLPALEAMACGTPVVASRNGALPEVLGNLGVYVDPLDVTQIAASIERICKEPAITINCEKEGPIRAKKFDWKYTTKKIERIINNLS